MLNGLSLDKTRYTLLLSRRKFVLGCKRQIQLQQQHNTTDAASRTERKKTRFQAAEVQELALYISTSSSLWTSSCFLTWKFHWRSWTGNWKIWLSTVDGTHLYSSADKTTCGSVSFFDLTWTRLLSSCRSQAARCWKMRVIMSLRAQGAN